VDVTPVLYSFRRCPYAIRARMAIQRSGVRVQLREVKLSSKPPAMLDKSPKGTVPVLVLPDGSVLDESLDIMRWALQQSDPERWLQGSEADAQQALIRLNDGDFKHWLDRYKYADRHPERPADFYRAQAEHFLKALERGLESTAWLAGATPGFVDIAVFPFLRQFSMVDPDWFEQAPYPAVRRWLQRLLGAELFTAVMEKYPPWQPEQSPCVFPNVPSRFRETGT
jgi:glutathione S-transferase